MKKRLLATLCALFATAMFSLLLLAIPPAGYSTISILKYRLFLTLFGVFVGGGVLLSVEFFLLSPHPLSHVRRPTPETVCALLYLLFTALSAAFSPYPGVLLGQGRQDGLVTISLYVFAFLLLRRHFHPHPWLLAVLGGSMCLYCLLGLFQLTGTNPFRLYPEGYNYYGAYKFYDGAFWSTTGNTNLCAPNLCAAAGLFLAALIRARSKVRWWLLVPLCFTVFSILALNVESAVVALLAGLLLLPPFVVAQGKELKNLAFVYGAVALTAALERWITFFDGGLTFSVSRAALLLAAVGLGFVLLGAGLSRRNALVAVDPRKLRCGLLLIALIVLMAALLFLYAYGGFPDGFLAQAHDLLHGRWNDSFGSGRLGIWREVLALVRERPILGGGPDTLGLRGLPAFTRYHEELGFTIRNVPDAAHNEFLNILVNQGGLALLAYLALLAFCAVRWWRAGAEEDDAAPLAGAAACLYLLQSFFGISSCFTTPYLWMALATVNKLNQERTLSYDDLQATFGDEPGLSPGIAFDGPRVGRRNGKHFSWAIRHPYC